MNARQRRKERRKAARLEAFFVRIGLRWGDPTTLMPRSIFYPSFSELLAAAKATGNPPSVVFE